MKKTIHLVLVLCGLTLGTQAFALAQEPNMSHADDLRCQIIDHIIGVEGGFVDDAADSGGATRYGITEATARRCAYTGSMADLSIDTARAIYVAEYWQPIRGDDLAAESAHIARELMDTAVNQGVGRAAEYLQRSLNVLNDRGSLYADLKVDRNIGPTTISIYRQFAAQRGDPGRTVLLNMLNCLQGSTYVSLAEAREKDERFVYGWFRARVTIV